MKEDGQVVGVDAAVSMLSADESLMHVPSVVHPADNDASKLANMRGAIKDDSIFAKQNWSAWAEVHGGREKKWHRSPMAALISRRKVASTRGM